MFEMRELKNRSGVIFCNLCNQINGKCVDIIVSAANLPCPIAIANVRKFLHMLRETAQG